MIENKEIARNRGPFLSPASVVEEHLTRAFLLKNGSLEQVFEKGVVSVQRAKFPTKLLHQRHMVTGSGGLHLDGFIDKEIDFHPKDYLEKVFGVEIALEKTR